jgi:hypothetical protein
MNRFNYLSGFASIGYRADLEAVQDKLAERVTGWRSEAGRATTSRRLLALELRNILRDYITDEAESLAVALVRSGVGSTGRRHALEAHLRLTIYWVRRHIWEPELRAARISDRRGIPVFSEDGLEEELKGVDCFSELATREFWRSLVSYYMGDEVFDLEEVWKRDPREWGRAVNRIRKEAGIPIQTKDGAGLLNGCDLTRRAAQDILAGKSVARWRTKLYIESVLAKLGCLPRTEKPAEFVG